MSKHLARRGGVWWARLVVPARLREATGRREFIQSCKTHELHIAKLVAAVLVAVWRRQLLELESVAMNPDVLKLINKAPALTVGGYMSIVEAAASIGVERNWLLRIASTYSLKLHCRLVSTPGHILTGDELERDGSVSGGVARVVPTPSQMPDDAIGTTFSGMLPVSNSLHVASAIISGDLESVDVMLFDLPKSPGKVFVPDVTVCCDVGNLEVETRQIDAIRLRLARELTTEQIQRAQEARTPAIPARDFAGKHANKLFSEALEAYCADASGLPGDLASVSEQRQRKNGMKVFAEFMGDLPLSEIDADKLRAFRDGPLRTLPGNANSLPKELRRPTMKETVDAVRAAGVDWPLMTLDMQRERMQWLGRLFAWLQKDWIKENPAASLQGETGRTRAERKDIGRVKDDDEGRGPFNPDELKLIFGQSWFQTGSGAHFKRPRKWYPFEYWLPLLGLYAGCRISEASQLHLTDIKRSEAGVWHLDINEYTKDKSVKNDPSKRIVPLHQVLIDLGFLEYCERLRQEGFRRVFPELTHAKTDARYAKESIRKMSAMLKALGMPRDLLHVFHCLRHNMNNGLVRVPLAALPFADEDFKKFIRYSVLGHKPGDDVNVRHYTTTTPEEMLALISGLAYDLPAIAKFDIDFAVGQIRVALSNKEAERRGREDMGPLNEEIYGTVTGSPTATADAR